MSKAVHHEPSKKWPVAWKSVSFRRKLIIGFILVFVILAFFPIFFQIIEKRNGRPLNDWLLDQVPAHDFSVLIFILIWATTLLLLVRVIRNPEILLQFLWAYAFLSLTRMTTIILVNLDPPKYLIPLIDPITNSFYGARYVTRDLFFSGHTSTVFLMAFCFKRQIDRWLAFSAATAVGILLLIQHVHYTIDILASPIITYIIYWLSKRYLTKNG
jgi:hypothetical protein